MATVPWHVGAAGVQEPALHVPDTGMKLSLHMTLHEVPLGTELTGQVPQSFAPYCRAREQGCGCAWPIHEGEYTQLPKVHNPVYGVYPELHAYEQDVPLGTLYPHEPHPTAPFGSKERLQGLPASQL
jgi:hypothetical protein